MTITRCTPLADLPELLKVDEVAVWQGCSKGNVYEQVRRGDLAGVRLGRLLRITRDSLASQAKGAGA